VGGGVLFDVVDDYTLFDVIRLREKEQVTIVDMEMVVVRYKMTVAREIVERRGRAAEALLEHALHL
jgi:hypothetical protein